MVQEVLGHNRIQWSLRQVLNKIIVSKTITNHVYIKLKLIMYPLKEFYKFSSIEKYSDAPKNNDFENDY